MLNAIFLNQSVLSLRNQFAYITNRQAWLLGAIILLGSWFRFQSTNSELPPYLFCDENIWLAEVLRMKSSHTFVTNVFISGPLNTYPVLITSILLENFTESMLTSANIVVLARLLLTFFVAILTSITLFILSRMLVRSNRVALGSVLLFNIAPYSISQSRIWYPDHYSSLFCLLLVISAIKVLQNFTKKQHFTYGVILGIALSVKFTLFFGIISLLYVQISALISKKVTAKDLAASQLSLCVGFIISFFTLNFSIIIEPQLFYNQMNFNFDLYKDAPGVNFGGYLYYLILLFLVVATPLSLIPIFSGMFSLYRINYKLFIILILPIFLQVLVMGRSESLLNRNINQFIPLVCFFVALGFEFLYSRRSWQTVLLCTVSLILITTQSGLNLLNETKDNSYLKAEAWIKDNIPKGSSVGVNWSCDIGSPADRFFSTTITGELGLDYHIFSSYWGSPFDSFYRDKSIIQELNPKYLHFYHNGDSSPLAFNFSHKSLDSLVPENYKLISVIMGNGPDFIVIQKDNLRH